jgi:hypothetical protein
MGLQLDDLLNIETFELYSMEISKLEEYRDVLNAMLEHPDAENEDTSELEESLDLIQTELQARGEY